MHIDAAARTVRLSVGEFACFSPYPAARGGEGFSLWRAQVGQRWHAAIQKQSIESGDPFLPEQTIEGALPWRGWTFQLSGRIDQLARDERRLYIREIKTVANKLPLDPVEIRSRYAHYCHQLLAYHELARQLPENAGLSIELDLLLVEIDTGITQTFALDGQRDTLLVDHCDRFADFLDAKRESLDFLRALRFQPAYETPRPGQETIQQDLEDALSRSPSVLLEAPTGYGKTGVAWECALRQLANGQADRVVYLTSKSTGQIEAARRLEAMLGPQPLATYWQIRNKREHCVNHEYRCSPASCSYLADLETKWPRSGLQRLYLLRRDTLSLDALKTESAAVGICPYETMRAALNFRHIWLGDYNYLFSPASSQLLTGQADFDPARTLLIVDEAHNLPARVEGNYTFDFAAHALSNAAEALRHAGASHRIRRLLTSLADEIAQHAAGDTLGPRAKAEFAESLVALAEALAAEPIPFDQVEPDTLETLWTIARAAKAYNDHDLPYLAWIPAAGSIRLDCLDASALIGQTLRPFRSTILLSATLSPISEYTRACGLDDLAAPPVHLAPPAPWQDGAYDVAIDTRVDTRFAQREKHLSKTAQAIAQLAEAVPPAVAFFPSYAYARKVQEELGRQAPFLRIAMQESGGDLAAQEAFIANSLAYSDIVFLILGSSFSEGIDAIGGKVGAAIVIGPALPEVNARQNAKKEHFDRRDRNGFSRAYLQPGIQKVNQALGRLVRAPGQKAKVLLHCQRFAEPATRALLAKSYQKVTYLMNDADYAAWLARS